MASRPSTRRKAAQERAAAAEAAKAGSSDRKETKLITTTKAASTKTEPSGTSSVPPPVTSVVVRAVEYKLNDYVLLRSETPGEPHYIGRIMAFPDKRRVRVAWFYRPQDVLNHTKSYPARLLVASMHSDINPVRSIVEKCTLTHLNDLADLDAYTAQDRTFYFHQLFDRFTKRVYDVIPAASVTNRPAEVLRRLRQFPYILVEEGRDKELKTGYSECRRCAQWVPKGDALECFSCHAVYHNTCLDLSKPKVGYQWQCHYCAVGAAPPAEPALPHFPEDDALAAMQDDMPAAVTPPDSFPFTYFGVHCSNADAFELDVHHPLYPRLASRIASRFQAAIPKLEDPSGAAAGSAANAAGAHKRKVSASASATLAWANRRRKSGVPAQEPTHRLVALQHMGVAPGTTLAEYFVSLPDRGDEAGLQWQMPDGMGDAVTAYGAKVREQVATCKDHPTATLDRAMFELHHAQYDADKALAVMVQLTTADILGGTYPSALHAEIAAARGLDSGDPPTALCARGDAEWTEQEQAQFVAGVEAHGFDLHAIASTIPTKPMAAIVLYLYRNKQTPAIQQALRVFLAEHDIVDHAYLESAAKSSPSAVSTTAIPTAASTTAIPATATTGRVRDDDESSLSSESEGETCQVNKCSLCKIKAARYLQTTLSLSAADRKEDKTVTGHESVHGIPTPASAHVLCEPCGQYWLRYGGFPPADVRGSSTLPKRRAARPAKVMPVLPVTLSPLSSSPSPAPLPAPPTKRGSDEVMDVDSEEPPAPPPKRRRGRTSSAVATASILSRNPSPPPAAAVTATSTASSSRRATPPAWTPPPLAAACALCTEGDNLLHCADCGLAVHATCARLSEADLAAAGARWRCGPCQNRRQPTTGLVDMCLLCPSAHPRTPPTLMRRTAKHHWVHFACALWTPEIKFTAGESLDLVTGLDEIPKARWDATCSLCRTPGGAVVACAQQACPAQFHVACAHRTAQFFGLVEMNERAGRKSGKAAPQPAIWCRHHVVPDAQLALPDAYKSVTTVPGGGAPAAGKRRGRNSKALTGAAAASAAAAATAAAATAASMPVDMASLPPLTDLKTVTGETVHFITHEIVQQVLAYATSAKVPKPRKRTPPLLAAMIALAPPTTAGPAKPASGVAASTRGAGRAAAEGPKTILDLIAGSGSAGGPITIGTSANAAAAAAAVVSEEVTQATPVVLAASADTTGGLKIKLKLGAAAARGDESVQVCAVCSGRTSMWWFDVQDSVWSVLHPHEAAAAAHKDAGATRVAEDPAASSAVAADAMEIDKPVNDDEEMDEYEEVEDDDDVHAPDVSALPPLLLGVPGEESAEARAPSPPMPRAMSPVPLAANEGPVVEPALDGYDEHDEHGSGDEAMETDESAAASASVNVAVPPHAKPTSGRKCLACLAAGK
ncbi:hypothetical protein AMAG_08546 [Allomyces macrogynus ATCC 38327]|uniref:Uncharacterized protein n=1 Tax=Allomyces macrogynus (strain ATCC 38327) TaxID=578462 RepID=A0A0L0SLJ0_ALLM3|nr:hypothetical protein AMAG_08546 [Allomyces macrogynus ATCC 38327]|eukprot:KNE63416.1 hypothetical protein AMAG_08546 [Allomyces macrogynus ATCC 38327]